MVGFIQRIKDFITLDKEFIFVNGDIDRLGDKTYLKRAVIEKVLGYVSRTFSTAEIHFHRDGRHLSEGKFAEWERLLNAQPNRNQNASEFWKAAIYTLLFENELLVIITDDNQLLIAEDYFKESTAVYGTTFKNVIVNGYEFQRTFREEDVIYVTYNNEELCRLIDGLFEDYAELIDNLLNAVKRNNQIRGVINLNRTGSFADGEAQQQKIQNYIDSLYSSFRDKQVATVPNANGFQYEELSNKGTRAMQPYDDIDKARAALVDDIAEIIGVPPNLIHGEKLDLESNWKMYRNNCIHPLIKLITDELNVKLLSKKEYQKHIRIRVLNVASPDIFSMSEAIDKLVSSGLFTPNDLLIELGREPSEEEFMNQRYMTKNYQEAQKLERGEKVDEENQD
ncbi:phage portal protein [Aerococcus kribbianus]|uniref:Phage portal protein n=1 Tax=Aerococcus kribbianus TaxID=2999064 RepID=A0A9X3FNK2_9LACT|nr:MULTISPECIES: phage portal protein [unclassified Aerococcus]MCZ0717838.1 phage portal protein [Aerococcus sp. YH-aer221]MCZ0726125.1 phage portal protein [Aerococcus sp. YH-aer222]